MKNFFKILILTILFASCEDSVDPLAKANGFAITAPTNNSPLILSITTDANTVAIINWEKSDNGVLTDESSYFIEVANSGTNFANPVTGNLESAINIVNGNRTYALKVKEINELANKLRGYECGKINNIDVRIKSRLGDFNPSAFFQPSSNFITVNITPYSTAKPTISFAKASTVGNEDTKLASSSIINFNDFEGYKYLTSGRYKFYVPDSCGKYLSPVELGAVSNGLIGTLPTSGTGNFIDIIETGYYFIKANLTANTYSILPYNTIGINGGGSRAGSGSANIVPMLDPENDNIWTLDVLLVRGKAIKFPVVQRDKTVALVEPLAPNAFNNPSFIFPASISGTPVQLGSAGEGLLTSVTAGPISEILLAGDFNASPNQKDKYSVTIDVRNPRKYTYTLVRI